MWRLRRTFLVRFLGHRRTTVTKEVVVGGCCDWEPPPPWCAWPCSSVPPSQFPGLGTRRGHADSTRPHEQDLRMALREPHEGHGRGRVPHAHEHNVRLVVLCERRGFEEAVVQSGGGGVVDGAEDVEVAQGGAGAQAGLDTRTRTRGDGVTRADMPPLTSLSGPLSCTWASSCFAPPPPPKLRECAPWPPTPLPLVVQARSCSLNRNVAGGGGGATFGMAKIGAEKIWRQFLNTTGKFGTTFPDCGTRTILHRGGVGGCCCFLMASGWSVLFPRGCASQEREK